MFRARFPELADVAVERCWSGPIAMTLDFLPAIGRSGRHDNVLFGIGYNGHGVAQASYVGTLLAKMASGEDPGHPELLRRRRLPMPPEPLRSLWARGILGALRALDRRTDRRAQPRPIASAARSPKRGSMMSRHQPRPDAGGGQWSEGRP